eukprot:gene10766-12557_t
MRFAITSIVLLALAIQLSRAFFLGDRLVNGGITSKVRALKPRSPANFRIATASISTGSSEEWVLKSVSKDKLFGIVSEAIAKQLDEVEAKDVKLNAHLAGDYEADSVDIVAVMLNLENSFQKELTETGVKVPMEKLGSVSTVEDLFNLTVNLLKEVELKRSSICS